MVDNFIVIQLIFAEIFVPQDFTIKLLLGSVEPQTHVTDKSELFRTSLEEEKSYHVVR